MNRKAANRELKELAKGYPDDKHPNEPVPVLAHLVKNAIDDEDPLCNDGKTALFFELITLDQINSRSHPDQFHDNFIPRYYSYSSYTFIALSNNESVPTDIQARFRDQEYLWVSLYPSEYECNSLNIEGVASITSKLPSKWLNEEILPSHKNVKMVFDCDVIDEYNVLLNSHKEYMGSELSKFQTNSSTEKSGINFNIPKPKEEIEETGKKISIGSVIIYKVGFANTIYIKYNNGKSILLDCGIDISYLNNINNGNNPGNYKRAHKLIKKLKPNTLIITHWHEDHYNLYQEIDISNLEQVIYTDYLPRNEVITKFNEWKKNNKNIKLIVINSDVTNYFLGSDYPCTSIWRGNGNTPPAQDQAKDFICSCSNKQFENDSGLIVLIENNGTTILPADVSYYCWPDEIKSRLSTFENIVLPHHSCQVYGLDNITQNTTFNNIFISSRFDNFIDKSPNKHRSMINYLINDTSDSRYSFTETIGNNSNNSKYHPYYQFKI